MMTTTSQPEMEPEHAMVALEGLPSQVCCSMMSLASWESGHAICAFAHTVLRMLEGSPGIHEPWIQDMPGGQYHHWIQDMPDGQSPLGSRTCHVVTTTLDPGYAR